MSDHGIETSGLFKKHRERRGVPGMSRPVRKGPICALLGAFLCAAALTGCSAAMQSVADTTDALLNGLADGTDTVLNDLADETDKALHSLADADNGQLKDSVLGAYHALVDGTGAAVLTPESQLKGQRAKGADDYTGSYRADYQDFTGTEFLFGGTTVEREAGGTVELTCSLAVESGGAAVFLLSGAEDPAVLLSGSGSYTGSVTVDGGSTYIGVWGDHATGTVSVEVK